GIFDFDQRFEDLMDGHLALPYRHLALLRCEVGQILDVHVEKARSRGVDRLDNVSTCAHAVTHIDAAAHPRIHRLYKLQHIEWRREDLVLGSMIVDGDFDVVFLHEFFHTRQRGGRWIAGNDDLDAG